MDNSIDKMKEYQIYERTLKEITNTIWDLKNVYNPELRKPIKPQDMGFHFRCVSPYLLQKPKMENLICDYSSYYEYYYDNSFYYDDKVFAKQSRAYDLNKEQKEFLEYEFLIEPHCITYPTGAPVVEYALPNYYNLNYLLDNGFPQPYKESSDVYFYIYRPFEHEPISIASSYTIPGKTDQEIAQTLQGVDLNIFINTPRTFYNRRDITKMYKFLCSENLYGTYENCPNLLGQPYCSNFCIDMKYTYLNCCKLTGNPMCSNNVINMNQTYYNCTNLTGDAVSGIKVQDMYFAYGYCVNLNGKAACGDRVTDMSFTYKNCKNLIGPAVCGNNVINMYAAYDCCSSLTGPPVFGKNVQYAGYAYGTCNNINGDFVVGSKVTDMIYTFYRSSNLSGNGYIQSEIVSNALYCFYIAQAKRPAPLNIFIKPNSLTNQTFYNNGVYSYSLLWTLDIPNNRYYFVNETESLYVYYNWDGTLPNHLT